jgi:excisionase family DNA binding protein
LESEILTIKQLAEYLKVNERTIYRLANKGDIPAFKVGNNWRFKASAIESWINQNSGSPLPLDDA